MFCPHKIIDKYDSIRCWFPGHLFVWWNPYPGRVMSVTWSQGSCHCVMSPEKNHDCLLGLGAVSGHIDRLCRMLPRKTAEDINLAGVWQHIFYVTLCYIIAILLSRVIVLCIAVYQTRASEFNALAVSGGKWFWIILVLVPSLDITVTS